MMNITKITLCQFEFVNHKLAAGLAGCGATVVHDLVYNPAEGK